MRFCIPELKSDENHDFFLGLDSSVILTPQQNVVFGAADREPPLKAEKMADGVRGVR